MGLQKEAIDSRLEGLKQDDCRMTFDSKLRAYAADGRNTGPDVGRGPDEARHTRPDFPIERITLLLEELSLRVDCLERKERAISEGIKRRARRGERRYAIITRGGLAFCLIFLTCWMMNWI